MFPAMTSRSNLDQFFYSGRIVAAFAMGGAVLAGLSVGWMPALAAFDVHAIGAAIGGVTGVIANATSFERWPGDLDLSLVRSRYRSLCFRLHAGSTSAD